MKGIRLCLIGFLVFFLTSCATTGGGLFSTGTSTVVTTGGPTAQEVVTYQGPKARIAVSHFDVKAAKAYWEIGTGISDMLTSALFRTNRFIVLERGAGLKGLKGEIELGQEGWVEESKEIKKGLFEGADVLVMGAITAFEPKAGGIGGGGIIIPLPSKIGGGILFKKEEAYIAAEIRLVDTRTSRVINATRVEGKASNFMIGGIGGALAGSVVLGAGLGKYENTPMEKAVMVMLDNAVAEISKKVPESYYRYTP